MHKLTKSQMDLVNGYADAVGHFKQNWVIWCVGGVENVESAGVAKKRMIYWAREAMEIAEALGLARKQVAHDIIWAVDNYEREAV